MKEKVDFLYQKIKLIISKFFDSDPKELADAIQVEVTTINRWGNPTKSPNRTNIIDLCNYINLDIDDFMGGRTEFLNAISTLSGLSKPALLEEWNKYDSTILRKTLQKSAKGTMDYYFSILKGNYYTFAHWVDPRQTPGRLIIKALINIYMYDESLNALRVRMLSKAYEEVIKHDVEWDYEGIIICYDQKMIFLFEDITKRTELVSILANIPESTDFDYIHGVLLAGLWGAGVIVSVPAASRIVFKKISESQPLEELRARANRTLSLDDIRQDDEKILDYISNKIDSSLGILTIPLPAIFSQQKKRRRTKEKTVLNQVN